MVRIQIPAAFVRIRIEFRLHEGLAKGVLTRHKNKCRGSESQDRRYRELHVV
jgi:hypothetical protein